MCDVNCSSAITSHCLYNLSMYVYDLSVLPSVFLSAYFSISVCMSVCLTASLPVCLSVYLSIYRRRMEASNSDVPPSGLESQGCQFNSTFLYLLSCSSGWSYRSFCLLRFCFWHILLTSFFLNLHFPKGRLFCVALVLSF